MLGRLQGFSLKGRCDWPVPVNVPGLTSRDGRRCGSEKKGLHFNKRSLEKPGLLSLNTRTPPRA